MEMMKQQQEMLQTMTALVPGLSPDKGIKRNIPAALGAPPKKQNRGTILEHELSEGELTDSNGEDTVSQKMDELLGGSEPEESEGDVYSELKSFFDKEEMLGEAVSGATAEVVDSPLVEAVMRSTVSHVKQKELLDKVQRPSNCEALQVPKVNPEIWKELKHS